MYRPDSVTARSACLLPAKGVNFTHTLFVVVRHGGGPNFYRTFLGTPSVYGVRVGAPAVLDQISQNLGALSAAGEEQRALYIRAQDAIRRRRRDMLPGVGFVFRDNARDVRVLLVAGLHDGLRR